MLTQVCSCRENAYLSNSVKHQARAGGITDLVTVRMRLWECSYGETDVCAGGMLCIGRLMEQLDVRDTARGVSWC